MDDDAIVALDLAVDHAVDAEVCPEQAAGLRKNPDRIGERPDRVVQTPQERLPAVAPAQCLFRAGAFDGRPHAFGGHFNQCDLISSPTPRRGAVDAERPEPAAAFDQRRADERRSLTREQLIAIRGRESRIGADVVDDHRLATAARVDDRLAEPADRAPTGERLDPVDIGPADDELLAIDVRVVDAAGVEMLPDQADGDFLDLDRVLQRA